jgi:hypothetical protein
MIFCKYYKLSHQFMELKKIKSILPSFYLMINIEINIKKIIDTKIYK